MIYFQKLINYCSTLLVFGMLGCAASADLADKNRGSDLQNYDLDYMHPDYLIFHSDEDSSELHFQFDLREFLFTRPNPSEPFQANIRLEYEIIDRSENKTLIAAGEKSFAFASNPDQPGVVNSFLKMPAGMGEQYRLNISLIDQNRGVKHDERIVIDKTRGSDQFYLMKTKDGKVIFHNWIAGAATVEITCNVNCPEELFFYHYTQEFSLPPPPFSMVDRNPFNLNDGEHAKCNVQNDKFYFNATQGLYAFHGADDSEILLSLWVDKTNYPSVTTLEMMTETSRYIMSRSEFEEMKKSKEPKAKMDAFWLENGGSKERARELIRTYYSRVEEANYFFTSYMPGWKTDRGLIHIIFGNPKKIFRGPNYETWLYGEENNLNSLSFTFNLDQDAISKNHYVLARDMSYRTFWDRAVQSWRSGRIYNQ